MKSRRDFLTGLSGIGVAAAFRGDAIARAAGAGKDAAQTPPHELAREEDYWSQIQRAFDVDRTQINLNNGGVAPCPSHVLDQMIRDLRFSQRDARPPHVERPRAAGRERPPRPGPRVRLRPRGDGDHPQCLGGP